MSQQLTISSLFSTLALVVLVLFARAGDMAPTAASTPDSQGLISVSFDR